MEVVVVVVVVWGTGHRYLVTIVEAWSVLVFMELGSTSGSSRGRGMLRGRSSGSGGSGMGNWTPGSSHDC